MFPATPAQQARRKLKEQAKAISRVRGETRGWETTQSDGMPVMQFVVGGRMQPELIQGSYLRWKRRSVSVLRRIPAPDWKIEDRSKEAETYYQGRANVS